MSRITPLEAPFEPEADAVLRTMMPRGTPFALFRTMAHNLEMARAMQTWGSYELSKRLSVGIRDREIVIDRTCAVTGCEYEWGVHIAFLAERAALTPEQITSLTHGGPSDSCWITARDQSLIRLVDALHASSDVADDLWEELAAQFAHNELLDLLALCGWYHAVSFIANATRVPLEDRVPRFIDVAPQPGLGG